MAHTKMMHWTDLVHFDALTTNDSIKAIDGTTNDNARPITSSIGGTGSLIADANDDPTDGVTTATTAECGQFAYHGWSHLLVPKCARRFSLRKQLSGQISYQC